MGIENKQCTSDYWAEDKSARFDRSLLPVSHPVYPSSQLLLHPCLTSSLPPPLLLSIHSSFTPPSHSSLTFSTPPTPHPSLASYRSFSLFDSLFSLCPSFTVLRLRSIKVCLFKTLWTIDPGSEEAERGHLAQVKRDQWVAAEVPLSPITPLFAPLSSFQIYLQIWKLVTVKSALLLMFFVCFFFNILQKNIEN